jgi:hypothetical protein
MAPVRRGWTGAAAAALLALLAPGAGCKTNQPLSDEDARRVGTVAVVLEPRDRSGFVVHSDDAIGDVGILVPFVGVDSASIFFLAPFGLLALPFAAAIDAGKSADLREALGPGFDVGPATATHLEAALREAGWKIVPEGTAADSTLGLEVSEATLSDTAGQPPGVRVAIRGRLTARDGAVLWSFADPGYARGVALSTELGAIWVRRDVEFEVWLADGGRLFREDALTYARRFIDTGLLPHLRARRAGIQRRGE